MLKSGNLRLNIPFLNLLILSAFLSLVLVQCEEMKFRYNLPSS